MTTFFAVDTHFGHGAIIEFAQRPCISADVLDRDLVDVWNGVVRPRDLVWPRGDFATGRTVTAGRCKLIFADLNGEKHLVQGSHDFQNADVLGLGWTSIQERKVLHLEGRRSCSEPAHKPIRRQGNERASPDPFLTASMKARKAGAICRCCG